MSPTTFCATTRNWSPSAHAPTSKLSVSPVVFGGGPIIGSITITSPFAFLGSCSTAPISVQDTPPSVDFSMTKRVSLSELSVQDSRLPFSASPSGMTGLSVRDTACIISISSWLRMWQW